MNQLIECIPNFSEGKDQSILDALSDIVTSHKGVALLDVKPDVSHNRTVFTFVGEPQAVADTAFLLCEKATELIDLRRHRGEHPRMGATDVIPFVPVKNVSIEECVALSKVVAKRIWEELAIPVFLYEASASSSNRVNLAAIRKGQFEGMPEKLKQEEWQPDFGKPQIHPSAGVVAVGARAPLVAFNINLNTDDLAIASAIAKKIRGSSGGYTYIKAIGVKLEERGIVQVSMNMVNTDKNPLYQAMEAVRFEARRYGVSVVGSEIIGLTPAKALYESAAYYLQLEDFDPELQVLENRVGELGE